MNNGNKVPEIRENMQRATKAFCNTIQKDISIQNTKRYYIKLLIAKRRVMKTIVGAVKMDSNEYRYIMNHGMELELDGERG